MAEPLPEAAPGYRWELQLPAQQQPRRRAWPWVIAVLLVAGLMVAAWFVAEALARSAVTDQIRERVAAQLALPASHPVHVEVAGPILPQLAAGVLDDVTVASNDVTLGSISGDIVLHARGLPIRGDAPMRQASATVTLDQAQLRALMATVQSFPADTLGLAAPNVTVTYPLRFFGASVPIGVALLPGAQSGALVLTPAALQLGGASIAADDLRARFGRAADAVLRDWTVCVRQHLPQGVTLASVAVRGATLVAGLDIAGGILRDPQLRQPGTCP